jgi:hypothetical protein
MGEEDIVSIYSNNKGSKPGGVEEAGEQALLTWSEID